MILLLSIVHVDFNERCVILHSSILLIRSVLSLVWYILIVFLLLANECAFTHRRRLSSAKYLHVLVPCVCHALCKPVLRQVQLLETKHTSREEELTIALKRCASVCTHKFYGMLASR